MHYVLMYDISSTKRLNKISKILLDYGARIQFSIFLLELDERILLEALKRIEKTINKEEDSFRVFEICQTCFNKRIFMGMAEVKERVSFCIL